MFYQLVISYLFTHFHPQCFRFAVSWGPSILSNVSTIAFFSSGYQLILSYLVILHLILSPLLLRCLLSSCYSTSFFTCAFFYLAYQFVISYLFANIHSQFFHFGVCCVLSISPNSSRLPSSVWLISSLSLISWLPSILISSTSMSNVFVPSLSSSQ